MEQWHSFFLFPIGFLKLESHSYVRNQFWLIIKPLAQRDYAAS